MDMGVPMRTLVWHSVVNFIVRDAMMLIASDKKGIIRTTMSKIHETHIL